MVPSLQPACGGRHTPRLLVVDKLAAQPAAAMGDTPGLKPCRLPIARGTTVQRPRGSPRTERPYAFFSVSGLYSGNDRPTPTAVVGPCNFATNVHPLLWPSTISRRCPDVVRNRYRKIRVISWEKDSRPSWFTAMVVCSDSSPVIVRRAGRLWNHVACSRVCFAVLLFGGETLPDYSWTAVSIFNFFLQLRRFVHRTL